MARQGNEITNPVTGERFVIRSSPDDNHASLEIDYFAQPGQQPMLHIHPAIEERIHSISGTWRFRHGREPDKTLGADESVIASPGIAHALYNIGQDEAHAVAEFRPGLKLADFFETVSGLARDGRTDERGYPTLLQVAVIFQEFGQEFVAATPPPALQKLIFAVLVPVARWRGYRSYYP